MVKVSRHLICGYGGFIGSAMYKYLTKKGHFVITCGGDLRDYNFALKITHNIDFVWHFAANFGGVGYFSKEQYYPTIDNFLIDLNVLRACEENKVKRLFYPASACAYPKRLMESGIPLEEDMLHCHAQPDQMYGWEKLTMIKLMRKSPIDCRVGILHTIYGESQAYEGKKAKFPPQIAYKCLVSQKTGKLEVWGDGTQTRTFLYIDDAIRKIYEVMMSKNYWGEVNIGSDKEVSVNDIVSLCCNILKIKPKIKYNLKAPVGPTRRLCSNEKFNKHYKTRDKVSLRKGFTNLLNFIKNDGHI